MTWRAVHRIVCRMRGHRWQRRSSGNYGITYECVRCGRDYASFCGCPSYWPHDDYWFRHSAETIDGKNPREL